MDFRQNPIAWAIAMTLAGIQGDVAAMPGPDIGQSRPIAENEVPPFDDAGVTLLSDDWYDEDDVPRDMAMFEGNDPFEIASLGEEGIALLAYGGTVAAPCRSGRPYGVANLTVVPPKGGIIEGSGANCGKSVPKKFDDGSLQRVCVIKSCKSYGDIANLQANALDGWEFVKWLGACKPVGGDPNCAIDLTRSKSVSAKFRKIK